MNDAFTQRVRAAAVAGWWTIIISAVWLTISWLMWLCILSTEPQWLITLWGGKIDWDEVRSITIRFIAVFKLFLWLCVTATIWLTIWARKLKRTAAAD